MSKRVSDIDLMRYLDGELSGNEAREIAAALDSDDDTQRAARSLKQLGECVRTYTELETDEADAALSRVWERVESKLAARGVQGEPKPAAVPRPVPRSKGTEAGAWVRAGRWLDSVRGYFVTGAAAAAAAAALVLVLSVGGDGQDPGIAGGPSPAPISALPAALTSQPPEVESLEIYGASGSVLTIPSGEEGGGTAVIWLDRQSDTEGPI